MNYTEEILEQKAHVEQLRLEAKVLQLEREIDRLLNIIATLRSNLTEYQGAFLDE